MKDFAELYQRLDATTKTNRKLAALTDYFGRAQPEDAAWAVYFLIGRRPKRLILARNLAAWAAEEAGIPDWLYGECYDAVGDSAETIALLLPHPERAAERPLHKWITESLLPLRKLDEAAQRERLAAAWAELDRGQRFVWNKLITGAFRVGVSQRLVTRALATVADLPADVIAHRLMGDWKPSAAAYRALLGPESETPAAGKPYPFFLAHPLQDEPATLGEVSTWQAEWKWDGIRAQLIRRAGETHLWSRGEELITDKFPEIESAAAHLPDGTVLDGEILAWKGGVLPFAKLQKRIGRKTLGPRILSEAPAVFLAFDLLEQNERDLRKTPLSERRESMESLIGGLSELGGAILVSPRVEASSWDALARLREESRERGVEGLMLKAAESSYGVGRERGSWWKWKVDPYTIDAVLIYAQRGSGRRASLYTDYTFGLWRDGELVPFAKAYSGLTDQEILEVDRFVRRNTRERFGPVRQVVPELVFELAFENIQPSTRHKSGVAVRFPRMARWRRDKKPADANSLEDIVSLIERA